MNIGRADQIVLNAIIKMYVADSDSYSAFEFRELSSVPSYMFSNYIEMDS